MVCHSCLRLTVGGQGVGSLGSFRDLADGAPFLSMLVAMQEGRQEPWGLHLVTKCSSQKQPDRTSSMAPASYPQRGNPATCCHGESMSQK